MSWFRALLEGPVYLWRLGLWAWRHAPRRERVWMAGVAHSAATPKCPSLMTIGQHDYIAVENATDVHESCRQSGASLALKVLSTEETAASPGHIDNPTQEFVFDWLRQNSTRPTHFRQRGRCV